MRIKNHFYKNAFQTLVIFILLLAINLSLAQNKKIDSLKNVLNNIKSEPNNTKVTSEYIDILQSISDKYSCIQKDSMLKYCKRALALSNQNKYKKGILRALSKLSWHYADEGLQHKALSYAKQMTTWNLKIKDSSSKILTHRTLAHAYETSYQYNNALKEYLYALKITEAIKDRKQQSILLNKIGHTYHNLGLYQQALAYYKESKKVIRFGETHASLNHNLAKSYVKIDSLAKAMAAVNLSISSYEKSKSFCELPSAYLTKGSIFLKQKKYSKALEWLHKSEQLASTKVLDTNFENLLMYALAETYLATGNHKRSLQYAKKGLALKVDRINLESISINSKILYYIFKQRNDPLKALHFYEMHQKARDSLSEIRNVQSVLILKTQMNYEKEKAAFNEKVKGKQIKYTFVAAVLILLLLGFLFIVKPKLNQKKELNLSLEKKQKKIAYKQQLLLDHKSSKNKLLSIIGHDLGGPISSFRTIFQHYESGSIKHKEFVNLLPKLRGDSDRLSFTLSNLISWGGMQKTASLVKIEIVSLKHIVDQNISIFTPIIDKKNILVRNLLPDDALAWADKEHILKIFGHLINNALKYTPRKGKITIAAKELEEKWRLSVTDTGIGINKIMQEALLKETQSNTFNSNHKKGSGKGLAICKELITCNNGEIWIESTINIGSSFYFTIPKFKKENLGA